MPRSISTSLRRALEEPRSQEYVAILLEITHPQLINTIRIANDVVDYEYAGNYYIGFPFEIDLVGDNARTPRGQLRIQNVDRRIGEAVLELVTPPGLSIMLFAQSDFHDTESGNDRLRVAISGIVPEYEAHHLVFGNVGGDATAISGDIISYDMSNEPWPGIRTTAERLPGLDP